MRINKFHHITAMLFLLYHSRAKTISGLFVHLSCIKEMQFKTKKKYKLEEKNKNQVSRFQIYKGRACHSTDQGRLEKWAHVTLMRFNESNEVQQGANEVQ